MREKKKIMITAGIIASVILVSLICINRGCAVVNIFWTHFLKNCSCSLMFNTIGIQ